MPNKIKLDLKKLKIQSFITALTVEEKNRYKGAGSDDCGTTMMQTCYTCYTCIPICTNTGGGCTGLPECCN